MIGTGIGPKAMPTSKYSTGTGYVALPSDMDRNSYIKLCYLRCSVSIRTEDGSFFNRVPVPQDIFNFIEFPEKLNSNGSLVVYITEEIRQLPIVIAILPKTEEFFDLEEYQLKIRRIYKDNHVEIAASPKNEYLSLTVDSIKSPKILINVFNDNKNGELNTHVQGDINTHADKDINLIQNGLFNVTSIDKDDDSQHSSYNQTIKQHHFDGPEFKINSGKEKMVLGNQLVTFLNNFIDAVSNITVVTALGLQPIVNKQQISNLKNHTNDILSAIGSLE